MATTFTFTDVRININGIPYIECTGFGYGRTRNVGEVFGLSADPIDIPSGEVRNNGTVTLLQEGFDRLQLLSPNFDITLVSGATVIFEYEKRDGSPANRKVINVLGGVRFESFNQSNAVGDLQQEIELPFRYLSHTTTIIPQ